MRPWVVFAARGLALAWAGFWIFFFAASAWLWRSPASVVVTGSAILALFVVLALLPWRREAAGGLLLAAAGLLLGVLYALRPPPDLPMAGRLMTIATLAGPPLIAGVLFRLHSRQPAGQAPPVAPGSIPDR